MKGEKVIRKVGWDTHGLPVELGVEKEFLLSNSLKFLINFLLKIKKANTKRTRNTRGTTLFFYLFLITQKLACIGAMALIFGSVKEQKEYYENVIAEENSLKR